CCLTWEAPTRTATGSLPRCSSRTRSVFLRDSPFRRWSIAPSAIESVSWLIALSAACAASSSLPPISRRPIGSTGRSGTCGRAERPRGAPPYGGRGPSAPSPALHGGGGPAVIRIAFDVVARKGVDALHRAVVSSGCRQVSEPMQLPATAGSGYGFGCKDPDGR